MRRGIYCGVNGPELETSAERRFFRSAGGDAVGMSTAPETILARHAGLKVVALSLMTNYAAGLVPGALGHEQAGLPARHDLVTGDQPPAAGEQSGRHR